MLMKTWKYVDGDLEIFVWSSFKEDLIAYFVPKKEKPERHGS